MASQISRFDAMRFLFMGIFEGQTVLTSFPRLQDVRNRIEQEFGDLRNRPNFVKAAVGEMHRRAADCVDQNLGHVE